MNVSLIHSIPLQLQQTMMRGDVPEGQITGDY